VEPVKVEVPFAPLGPAELFPSGTPAPKFEPLDVQAAREPGIERLRLGPPVVPSQRHVFELFQSLAYGVQNSREYQTRMEDLYLAALEVTLQRHVFEPRPFVTQSLTYNGGQRDVAFRSALTAATTAGVRQRLPYGGEVVASALVDFVQAINDNSDSGESASLALSGSIPLLRGAGFTIQEPLIQSERSLVYEVRRFEDFRRDFAVNIATRYLRLLARQNNIANRRFNYASLADLTERTLALYAAGRINFLQVQRSLQQQLQVESSLITAQQTYQSDLDDFKIILGMPVEAELEIVPIQLTVDLPDIERIDSTGLAMKYRLDLITARDQVEDAQRAVQVAQNALLPELDLTADGRVGNRADTPASRLDSRTLSYSAGVTLDLPVDRVAERNVYRRTLISLERANRNVSLTSDQVIADVRSDVRGIRSAQITVEIQRRGIELAQRRLDFSTELLVQGRSTDSRDVTDAQSSLLSAQDAYEQARADLQIQVLQFLRDTGTLRIDPEAGTFGWALDRQQGKVSQLPAR
jgi:outer membrane protein TolC